ncbi:hypothetical protein CRYUN_Cryun36dG0095600 [Craigia yunnanensis]
MAYDQVDHNLQKIALDGFDILDKRYGRGSLQRLTPPPPPPPTRRPQDQYHHQKKLAPNQYSYQEPDQAYVTAKEPAFRNYRPPTKQCYETWYFLPVSQAPKQEGTVISSRQAAENYGGILFNDYGYKSKPYRWGYNYD